MIANVTDIDDKILIKSAEAGVPWCAHAYRYERELHEAYAALGCLPPTLRAAGHRAHPGDARADRDPDRARARLRRPTDGSGDVYFDVRSWPAYGSLSRQRIDDMEPAADADPRGKRDPRDFALWKGHKPDEPDTASWPTPWGRGRPGWHLECSAMAGKYLGDEFDIHGGGIDLRFPHHENELAQSTAAGQRFARYWMHNAWVTAAGEKMSKSLGNGALVSEVVQRYPARAVRFYLAQPHYRSAIEFSDASLAEAAAALARIEGFVARATELVGGRRRPCRTRSPPRWTTTSARRRRWPCSTTPSARATSRSTTASTRRRSRARLARGARHARRPRARPGTRSGRHGRRRRQLTGGGRRPGQRAAGAAAGGPRPQGLRRRRRHPRRSGRARRRDRGHRGRSALVPRDRGEQAESADMPGNSQRKGAVAQAGKGNTAGSGGRVRRGLEGKGPTPKAEDRPYHRRTGQEGRRAPDRRTGQRPPRERRRTGRPGRRAGVGRRAQRGAGGAARPRSRSRPRTSPRAPSATTGCARSSSSPPSTASPLLEVTRAELDRPPAARCTRAWRCRCRRTSTPTPTTCSPRRSRPTARPLIVALDGVTDPRNLGAIVRSAAAFGAHGVLIPERRSAGMTAAAWKTSAGAAARIPVARATNLNRTLQRVRRRRPASWSASTARRDIDLADLAEASGRSCWSSAARATACPGWSARPATPWPPSRWPRGRVPQRRRRRRHRAVRDRPPPLTGTSVEPSTTLFMLARRRILS